MEYYFLSTMFSHIKFYFYGYLLSRRSLPRIQQLFAIEKMLMSLTVFALYGESVYYDTYLLFLRSNEFLKIFMDAKMSRYYFFDYTTGLYYYSFNYFRVHVYFLFSYNVCFRV